MEGLMKSAIVIVKFVTNGICKHFNHIAHNFRALTYKYLFPYNPIHYCNILNSFAKQ